ncbi:hypothetical protein GALL_341090 [mine drainage metagenome]|uniref:Uncharacterized protein n=1 Tax=mine drainage metagenome TaxID=410659 RepID=A0A1J5QW48_9ZZZZ
MFVQRHGQYGAEFTLGKRFDHVAKRFGQLGARQNVIGGKSGQENHRQGKLTANGLRRRNAVHGTGELDVHQHQVWPQDSHHFQRLLALTRGTDHAVTQHSELLLDVAHHQKLVFNDQYLLWTLNRNGCHVVLPD